MTTKKLIWMIPALAALAACSGGESQNSGTTTTAAGAVSTATAVDPNASLASLTGNSANGEKVFAKCAACHSLEAGKNGLGPSLHGVVGRKAGSVEGYVYSTANKASGDIWAGEMLFTYLENPRKVMPGTKMSFVGLSNPQDRADVIAYLATMK